MDKLSAVIIKQNNFLIQLIVSLKEDVEVLKGEIEKLKEREAGPSSTELKGSF